MKRALLWITLVCLCSSCRSDMDDFQQNVLRFARDGRLDVQERRQLVSFARASGDRRFRALCYTGQRFDEAKLDNYLHKFLASHDLSSTVILEKPAGVKPFGVEVYLENSASMDAYVNGPTRFKDDIYALLGDISLSKSCSSLGLHYINSSITYTKDHAGPGDIRSFIQTLTPATFRKRGGNRSSSDLRQVLQSVLDGINGQQAAILISDFVFSPEKGVNAGDYLNNERIGIKMAFAGKMQAYGLSLLVFQCYSNFKGYYYDAADRPVKLATERPFYVWVMGSDEQLGVLLKQGVLGSIRTVAAHQVLLRTVSAPSPAGYKILYDGRIGTFSLRQGAQGPLSNVEAAGSGRNAGRFSFRLDADFSGTLQDSAFFNDSSHYELSNGYRLSVRPVAGPGYTHQLTLTTVTPREEQLHIAVRNLLPAWVLASASENDAGIAARPDEQRRTFGLKQLLGGVFDAFYPLGQHDTICRLDIEIKK